MTEQELLEREKASFIEKVKESKANLDSLGTENLDELFAEIAAIKWLVDGVSTDDYTIKGICMIHLSNKVKALVEKTKTLEFKELEKVEG